MTRNKLLAALSLALVCTPAFAEGDAAAGKETFEEVCESCHFEDDFADEADSVIDDILMAILNGEIRHRGGFKDLTEEDVANLAAFLAEQ